jgi:hypothetical protein
MTMQSSFTIATASATPSASSDTSSILALVPEFLLHLLRWRFCSGNFGKKLADPGVSNYNIVAIAFAAITIPTSLNDNYAAWSIDLIQLINVIPDQRSFAHSFGCDGVEVC